MNLSPQWVAILQEAGHSALHWSAVGDPSAGDAEIFAFARREGLAIFTHDLDFGTLLAHTKQGGQSVIQLRAPDVSPRSQWKTVIGVLERFGQDLANGALVTIEPGRERVRLLPLQQG